MLWPRWWSTGWLLITKQWSRIIATLTTTLITMLGNFEPQGLRTKFELDLMELQMTGLAKVHHVLTPQPRYLSQTIQPKQHPASQPSSSSSPKTPGGSLEQPGQTQPSKVASEDNEPFFVWYMKNMHLLPENWGSTLSIDRRAKKSLWFVYLGICATSSRFFKDSLTNSTIVDCPKVAPQIWSEYEYFRWMEQE